MTIDDCRSALEPRHRWMVLLLRAADEAFAGPNRESARHHAWVHEYARGSSPRLDLFVQTVSPDGLRSETGVVRVAQGLRTGLVANPVAVGDDQGRIICAWESPAERAIRVAVVEPGCGAAGPSVRVDGGDAAERPALRRLTARAGGGFIVRWDEGDGARFARLFDGRAQPLCPPVHLPCDGPRRP